MAPELKDLLRDAAARPADPIDLEDVRRRAAGVARGRRVRTAIAGVAVVALFAAVAVPLLQRVGDSRIEFADTPPVAPPALTTDEPYAPSRPAPPRLWKTLPAAPIVPRVEPVAVWSGEEMIVWGGQDPAREYEALSDGVAYDPEARTWRTLPEAPLPSGGKATGVWSGAELLVWVGGVEDGSAGAGYNPQTDKWRLLPAAPIEAYDHARAVWTGEEMIVWGGYDPRTGFAPGDGAAYNPAQNAWRRLPAAPIDGRFYFHQAVWTGDEMIVWGGTAGDGAEVTRYSDGAAYSPRSDSWRKLSDAPLEPREPGGVLWSDDRLVVLGGYPDDSGAAARDGAIYDVDSNQWSHVDATAPQNMRSFIAADSKVVGWGASVTAAIFEPEVSAWFDVPDAPVTMGLRAAAVWTGQQVLVWGGETATGEPVADGVAFNPTRIATFEGVIPPPTEDAAAGAAVGEATATATEAEQARGESVLPLWPIGHSAQRWATPEQAAVAFGREMLGWRDARVSDGEPTEDGRFGERLTLTSDEVQRSVDLVVVPDRGAGDGAAIDGAWVVTSVNVPDIGDTTLGVSIRGKRVQVSFDGWNGPPALASAELRVEYPDQGSQATASSEPLDFDIDLSHTPTQTGSVLVLFRDDQGRVVGAIGTGVPAGDFAAG